MKKEFTNEYLGECLDYNHDTGILSWKFRPPPHFKNERAFKSWNARFAGKEAFTSEDSLGYKQGSINNHTYRSHRIIWKLVYDTVPEHIDHINGNRTDNRIINLRSVNQQENLKNQKKRVNNTSGVNGVFWNEKRNCWISAIRFAGKNKHLGCFKNLEDAVDVRKKAEIQYGYHPNHGS